MYKRQGIEHHNPLHKKSDQCDWPVCLSMVVHKLYTTVLEPRLRTVIGHLIEEKEVAFQPDTETQNDHRERPIQRLRFVSGIPGFESGILISI